MLATMVCFIIARRDHEIFAGALFVRAGNLGPVFFRQHLCGSHLRPPPAGTGAKLGAGGAIDPHGPPHDNHRACSTPVLSRLPLATATTIMFTHPILVTLLSLPFWARKSGSAAGPASPSGSSARSSWCSRGKSRKRLSQPASSSCWQPPSPTPPIRSPPGRCVSMIR